ncbi:hypothetical protein [Streptomyces spectabilis]|uniref:Uncharacterized protein n=1 Tax=Streptomyces spectabilis TaxID=68270 RepID=A0A516RK01_STRST|nr:hypothetical protein [Streptomyces spectabilis]QDQ15992.1 hypothetical protein FH965_40165 [Streptomyces spectabilis]
MTRTALAIPFDRLERALSAWLPALPGRSPARRVSIEELGLAADGPRPAGTALVLVLGLRTHHGDHAPTGTHRLAIAIHPLTDLPADPDPAADVGVGAGEGPRLIAVLDDVVICQGPPAAGNTPA